jgi:predicted small integral membrane protein
MDFSWMAWTAPTATFFAVIVALIAAMGLWEKLSPGGAPRKGVLGIVTYRGNRLFVSLLGAGFIHLAWIAVTTVSLWGATALSVAFAVAVFVFV